MQSTMSCPRAGPSSDLFARPAPSNPRPRASQSSKTVGHFDADELTLRLQQVLANQRAHEQRQRHARETNEARRRLQLAQQQQQEHLHQLHAPHEAARQFSRTTTTAGTLHAMQQQGREGNPSSPAMRYNQGLPVAPAHGQATHAQPQFPFPSSHPHQQAGPDSSTDSTPPPLPPALAMQLPLAAELTPQKQTKPKQQDWKQRDSAATTVVGHVSVSVSTPAPSGSMGAAPVGQPSQGGAAKGPAVWTPLLKKADSLWGLRGRSSRAGSKGSLKDMVDGGGKGKGVVGEGMPLGEVVEAEGGGKAGKGGKRFFGKFR